ncbi:MAG: hypothetical protein JXR21_02840 [Candidatus Marinimicrobia bacterium]|nr:hypothetical protein [Candidatus Neomarinimicrobiota bacterium]
MKRFYDILWLLCLFSAAYAVPLANTFTLEDTLVYDGLGSNSVTDIVQLNDSTFVRERERTFDKS